MRRTIVFGVVTLIWWGSLGASCDSEEDFARSVSGPGIEVNCAQGRTPGVGNTRVDVICPGASE